MSDVELCFVAVLSVVGCFQRTLVSCGRAEVHEEKQVGP